MGIVYDQDGETFVMRPDFLFFRSTTNGEIVVDLVDPHGHHLSDSLPKLKGLAAYAEKHGHLYGRIDAVSETENGYHLLDMKCAEVRAMVRSAASAKLAYDHPLRARPQK